MTPDATQRAARPAEEFIPPRRLTHQTGDRYDEIPGPDAILESK